MSQNMEISPPNEWFVVRSGFPFHPEKHTLKKTQKALIIPLLDERSNVTVSCGHNDPGLTNLSH